MPRTISTLLIGLSLCLAGVSSLRAEPHLDRCVILISIDGLAAFYFDDPLADIPTLRRLAKAGARAEGLVCSFPTVTWPNHTTLVTGVPPAKHGVIGNNYLDRTTGEKIGLIIDPLFDKHEIVRTPTIYDDAQGAGMITAGIVWPATRNARTLDFQVPDMPGDAWNQYGSKDWLEELRAAGIPVDKHGEWCKESSGGVQRDWLYTVMAKQLFEKHPPNLLLIHLIEVDHVQHKFGPRSPEAYWAVKYADDRVRDIVEAAEASSFGGKVTYVIASDHGFYPIEKDIRPNVRLRQLGLVDADGTNVQNKRAWCVSQGGGGMVYVLDDANRAETIRKLAADFAQLEGVDEVVTQERFAEIGVAHPQEDPRAPDLWLSAKSGYSFTDTHTGDEPIAPREKVGGTHGYLPEQTALHGTLILSGGGIAPGVNLGIRRSLDVAPTMAWLLGVELPSADGQPLSDALLTP